MSARPGDAPTLRSLRLLVQSVWQAGRWLAVLTLVQELTVAVAHIAALYGGKVLVDGAIARSSSEALAGGLIIATAMAARQVCSWADGITDLRERTAQRLEERIVELSASLPGVEHHERPELLDQLQLVREQRFALGDVVYAMSGNIANVTAMTASAVLLARLHPLLLLVALAGTVSFVFAGRVERITAAAHDRTAPEFRLARQLEDLVHNPANSAELRLHRVQDLVMRRHHEADEYTIVVMQRAQMRAAILSLLSGGAVFVLAQLGAIAFVVRLGATGRLSAGDVVLAIGLVRRAANQLNGVIGGVTQLLRQLRAVRRLAWLMDESASAMERVRPTRQAALPRTLHDGIRLEDVTFAYPGTAEAALRGVDLVLPAGTTVALVGENGAGKSTLVKLLLRMYEPSGGRIVVDGTDLRDIDVAEWRARASGAFQDPARPELVVREVVGLGSLPSIEDVGSVQAAVDAAGAERVVAELPRGLDTPVGPSFDIGAQLSGGQWQLLALARAMMRERSLLVVLDEPTAALDPGREHALFERYAKAAEIAASETGGVTVLVSHRFSTVRMADLIVVIDDGRVRESGSHDELMRQNGLYAELYSIQAAAYRS